MGKKNLQKSRNRNPTASLEKGGGETRRMEENSSVASILEGNGGSAWVLQGWKSGLPRQRIGNFL